MKYLLILLFLVSCETKKPKKETVKIYKTLTAKTVENISGTALSKGAIYYVLAFDDGSTEYTSFGYYACLNIGDTVMFYKEDDFWGFFMRPNCK